MLSPPSHHSYPHVCFPPPSPPPLSFHRYASLGNRNIFQVGKKEFQLCLSDVQIVDESSPFLSMRSIDLIFISANLESDDTPDAQNAINDDNSLVRAEYVWCCWCCLLLLTVLMLTVLVVIDTSAFLILYRLPIIQTGLPRSSHAWPWRCTSSSAGERVVEGGLRAGRGGRRRRQMRRTRHRRSMEERGENRRVVTP